MANISQMGLKDKFTMKTVLHPASGRGSADHGWLKTKFSFSFAEYYNPQRIHFGMLRVINDDIIQGGGGFPMHPHNNMEIITIPQYGSIRHTDSMGNTGVISAHEIQVMSAGSGIFHSEYNESLTEELNLFQIWILTEKENITPRYDQKKYDEKLFINHFYPVVSPGGEADTLKIHQQAWISLGNFDKDVISTYHVKRKGNGVFVFVIEGKAEVDGEILLHRDAIGVSETDQFDVKIEAGSRLMLLDVPMN